jgi:hypothetical protein
MCSLLGSFSDGPFPNRLAGQLELVRVERHELAVAKRVWARMSEQIASEHAEPSAAAASLGHVAGAAVLHVAHHSLGVSECVLAPDY